MIRALLLVAIAAGAAQAEPSKPVVPRAIKEKLDSAKKHFDLQEYAAAEEDLKAVYLINADPQVLYAIAQAQRMNNDCEHAIVSYRSFLRASPRKEQAKLAEDNIATCEAAEKQRAEDRARADAAEAARREAAQRDAARAQQPPPPARPFEPPPPHRSPAGKLLLFSGMPIAGIGVALAALGQHRIAAVNDAAFYDDYVAAQRDAAGGKTLRTAGFVVAGAGVALIVGGVIALVTGGASETSVATRWHLDATGVAIAW